MKKLYEFWPALFRRYLASWHTRWAAKTRKDRAILAGKLIGLLAALWLAFWYISGPSSVDVGDIHVDLDRSMSLAGPDQDRNGIRDDVDRYIEALVRAKGYSKPQAKAIRQEARSMQKLVTVNLNDPKAIGKVDSEDGNSIHCLFDQLGPDDSYVVLKQINKLTANTKARVISYLKYNHSQDGSVSILPQGNTCEP